MPDLKKAKLIADHPKEKAVTQYLIAYPTLNVICQVLDQSGVDYILSEDCAIQRKDGADLVSSIIDGRYKDIYDQKKLYDKLILVIEDLHHGFERGSLNPKVVWGAIAACIKHNISVVFTKDPEETALFLERLAVHLCKEDKNHPLIKKKPALTIEEKQLQVLQSYEAIGAEISIRILAKYHNLWNFYNAIGRAEVHQKPSGAWEWVSDPDDLQSIERFGPALCFKIKKILGI